ncbi:stamen-specific protein FIL1-like [Cornus florida]|uniref:stamen-specific protein FIL1-like n=1 Tax=Cornus florida TaxID=4283 RepID=UPI00289FD7A4|nr:stamen-specific protein FIL1-like [Cornus florida]
MAGLKSVVSLSSRATLLFIMLAVLTRAVQSQPQNQGCSAQLSNLNVCAPFVVPGANTTPSRECCGALQAVDNDCICSTLRISARLPSQCNIPAATCNG